VGIVKRVYGRTTSDFLSSGKRDGQHSTCYLTRIKLTPKTWWGQLYFHVFHRGDLDRDFHDHPYDFWTFPLVTYYEDVLDHATGRSTLNEVKAFRWHFRPAEYTHIQLGAVTGFKSKVPLQDLFGGWTATFLWRKPTRRMWGFWVRNYEIAFEYLWVPWRKYLFS